MKYEGIWFHTTRELSGYPDRCRVIRVKLTWESHKPGFYVLDWTEMAKLMADKYQNWYVCPYKGNVLMFFCS